MAVKGNQLSELLLKRQCIFVNHIQLIQSYLDVVEPVENIYLGDSPSQTYLKREHRPTDFSEIT
jgi:hypothetical protein